MNYKNKTPKSKESAKQQSDELTATVQKLVETNLGLEFQIKETKKAEKDALNHLATLDAIAKYFPNGMIVVFNSAFQVEYAEGEEFHTTLENYLQLKKGLFIDHIEGLNTFQKDNLKNKVEQTLNGVHLNYEVSFEHYVYNVNTTPLLNNHGDNRALMVYTNITAQKKIEQEIKNNLQKERELNELKSRFITIASHEFRTPLTAISLSADLIQKLNATGNEEKRLKYLEKIKNNVTNLVVILDDFLSLSKLEEGQIIVHPSTFDLVSFSKHMIETIEDNKKTGQTIALETVQPKIDVLLDKKLMHYIVLNLLSNAIKYSSEAANIILKLSTIKNNLRLEVIDHGMGIPESEQPQLFKRFFRANNVTNIQGTGLGLPIVKQYTELMDGTIRFESTLNQGTTFILEFPKTVLQ